jgi:serine/threonine protein kinase
MGIENSIGDIETMAGPGSTPSGAGRGKASFSPGDRVGEYRIVRLLGRGGMGEVYEAEHSTLGRRYALKFLPADFAKSSGAIERFRREAKVMANLEHPNIVKVDDFDEFKGRYWLRMELVSGVEVDDLRSVVVRDLPPSPKTTADRPGSKTSSLRSPSAKNELTSCVKDPAINAISLSDLAEACGGKLDEGLLSHILHQILDALSYAHAKGAIHRDLKPGNILLDCRVCRDRASDKSEMSDLSDCIAKISDFGLVRLVGEDWIKSQAELSVKLSLSIGDMRTMGADPSAGSSTRSLIGTYEYMSPEQKSGGEAGKASDVYAIGLMAYKLLTGKNIGPRPPSYYCKGISPKWDDFVFRSLEEDPSERFPDASAMLSALDPLLRDIEQRALQRRKEAERIRLEEAECERLRREQEAQLRIRKEQEERQRQIEAELARHSAGAGGLARHSAGAGGLARHSAGAGGLARPAGGAGGKRRSGEPERNTKFEIQSSPATGGAKIRSQESESGMEKAKVGTQPAEKKTPKIARKFKIAALLGILLSLCALGVWKIYEYRVDKEEKSKIAMMEAEGKRRCQVVQNAFSSDFAKLQTHLADARNTSLANSQRLRATETALSALDDMSDNSYLSYLTYSQQSEIKRLKNETAILKSEIESLNMPTSQDSQNASLRLEDRKLAPEKPPGPETGKDWIVPDIGMEFVWIKALNCWVGKYEVTNGEYRKFKAKHDSNTRVDSNGSTYAGDHRGNSVNGDDNPVVLVSMNDAQAFARWLTEREKQMGRLPQHLQFRLPTEVEWNSFAQCGDNRIFPWGNDWPPLFGNYGDNEYNDGFPSSTCPVQKSGRNDWGLYGIGGNAWEWTVDSNGRPVEKGGSWGNPKKDLRCTDGVSFRGPDYRDYFSGFRLILSR